MWERFVEHQLMLINWKQQQTIKQTELILAQSLSSLSAQTPQKKKTRTKAREGK